MQTFIHYDEPYGTVELRVKTVESIGLGRFKVTGVVTRGNKATALYCGQRISGTGDMTGRDYAVTCNQGDLDKGYRRDIAM